MEERGMSPTESTVASRTTERATPAPAAAIPERPLADRIIGGLWWALRFALALFLFVGALQLMKTGAAGLDILQNKGLLVRNPGSTLGLGWLGALFVLSGSPIAATSLTLVAADSITEIQGFTMLTGSRLGAAFVVLVVAVVYALKSGEGERLKPVSTAVMALSTTALIYIPASVLGLALLRWQPFHELEIVFPQQFGDLIDLVYGGLLGLVEDFPGIINFLGGLGVLLLSFKLIDGVMPAMDESTIESHRLQWLRRKWPMFGLGSLVALVTMSVSVALTVLVPLVAKKYVKREDILPYIMGANITTLGDTMLAAFSLNSPAAVRIVLAGVVSASILSVILLAFFYPQTRRMVWKFQRQMVLSKTRLAAFTAALFLVPIAIIAVSGTIA
jgi:solute carrier family 34 (sodium-dependent phosphate cotransporter)